MKKFGLRNNSEEQQHFLQDNIERNKEYYENLRKCYDLADHLSQYSSPLYFDRAR